MTSNLKKIIPNIITVMRLLFAILIIVFLLLASNCSIQSQTSSFFSFSLNKNSCSLIYWILAGITFLIAAFSDFLDGYLARKWKVESDFGRFFDPLTDKLVVNLTSLMLVIFFKNMFPFYLLIIFLIRDYLVDGLRLFLSSKNNVVLGAKMLGKLKTVTQLLAILIIFFVMPIWLSSATLIIYLLLIPLFLAAILSIVSGFYYFWFAFKNTNIFTFPLKSINQNNKNINTKKK